MAMDPATAYDQDAELLRDVIAARDGDLRAFEKLVAQYQKRILADCRYLTRDESISEDLAQEVFVKAYFGIQNFEGKSTFRHWLQTIKVHHCLNHLRKGKGKDFLSIDEDGLETYQQLHVAAVPQRNVEAAESRQRIGNILGAMPATLRIPLVMCDIDELSYEEIAAALGIGLSAVKMRIKRAREMFRQLYGSEGVAARHTAV